MTARQAVERYIKKRGNQNFNVLHKGHSGLPSKVGEVFTSINAKSGHPGELVQATLKGLKSRKKRVAKLLSLGNLGNTVGEKENKIRKNNKTKNALTKNRLQS